MGQISAGLYSYTLMSHARIVNMRKYEHSVPTLFMHITSALPLSKEYVYTPAQVCMHVLSCRLVAAP